MRRCFVFLFAVVFTLAHNPANAAPDTPPTTAFRYTQAMSNLRHEHDFALCVQQLQYLTTQDSANRDYHLALGCAEADRAVSLGYAALFTQTLDDERTKYPQAVKDWQGAQADPKSDNYGDPRPDLPPLRTFVTKDDDHPFLLSQAQTIVQINALTKDAQAHWTRALTLSPTPGSRAEAEYVQGWGLTMLRLLAANDISGGGKTQKPLFAVPGEGAAARAFAAAVKDAPQNAVYWQSLGDAQYDKTDGGEFTNRTEAQASYAKSLALQPINAPLWFRVSRMNSPVSTKNSKANPQDAQSALKHVVDSDPGNAFPHYLLAGILFKQTHYSDPHDQTETADQDKSLTANYDTTQQAAADSGLREVEQGNACPRYESIRYQPPYPSLLTGYGVWENLLRLSEVDFGNYSKLRELARACGGYARIQAAQGDALGVQRGARACINMGMKMAGDWPTQDKAPGDDSIVSVLVGEAVIGIGYSDLVKSEGQIGDVPGQHAAQAEYDAFKQKQTAYKLAAQQSIASFSLYDYY